jgi:biotin transport system substrate-specific component
LKQTKVFADFIYSGQGIVADGMRIITANILLVLCAQIAVPLPWSPVPITGQTFGVLFVAVLLGSRRSALALLLYLLEGISGLPVFQPFGLPGPARFFGPTAGYLFACPPAAFLTGWVLERGAMQSIGRVASALLSGEAVIFLGGCAWLASGIGLGWSAAIRLGVLPFIPGEIIKLALIVAAVYGAKLARGKA